MLFMLRRNGAHAFRFGWHARARPRRGYRRDHAESKLQSGQEGAGPQLSARLTALVGVGCATDARRAQPAGWPSAAASIGSRRNAARPRIRIATALKIVLRSQ